VSSAWQWPSPLTIEKDLKPTDHSNGMNAAESQKDAALLLSDGGPLRRVRDPGGLESEGLSSGVVVS